MLPDVTFSPVESVTGAFMSAATEQSHEHATTQTPPAPAQTDDPEMAGGLGVTETAAAKIREIREAEAIEGSYALRVKVMGGGCSGFQYDLYFDEPAEGDQSFTSNGVHLVCDQMSFMYLMGTQIDYVEGLQGAGFK